MTNRWTAGLHHKLSFGHFTCARNERSVLVGWRPTRGVNSQGGGRLVCAIRQRSLWPNLDYKVRLTPPGV